MINRLRRVTACDRICSVRGFEAKVERKLLDEARAATAWATLGVASWLLVSPWLLGIGHLLARIDFWIRILVAYIALIVLWLLHDSYS